MNIYSLFNFLIYNFVYIYILVSIINFYHCITSFISIFILIISAISSFFSIKFRPFRMFLFEIKYNYFLNKHILYLVFFILAIWLFIVINRPSTGVDANVYHLPLSLLINKSVWYPGIAKLSSHFGFPNGASVLASVFTSFDHAGFEGIPSIVTWIIYGIGIFLYLVKNHISAFTSLIITWMFLITPEIFLASYTMGTDLPCACFLTFGLMAIDSRKFEDTCLFFSLSAIFKTLGVLAFFMAIPYVLYMLIRKDGKRFIWTPKVLLSLVLLAISLLRVYIATGNPIYPAIPINLMAPWGISQDIQNDIIYGAYGKYTGGGRGLKNYAGIERTLSGVVMFMIKFFVSPHGVKSGYWFSPFFAICLITSFLIIVKEKNFRFVNVNFFYTYFIISILTLSWMSYSPLFRFISGVLVYINIKLFIFVYIKKYNIYKIINILTLYILVSLFSFNLYEKIDAEILPLINADQKKIESFMPWSGSRKSMAKIFTIEQTEGGFAYSKSTTNYCQRMPPPCINGRSLDNEKILIQLYRMYNDL